MIGRNESGAGLAAALALLLSSPATAQTNAPPAEPTPAAPMAESAPLAPGAQGREDEAAAAGSKICRSLREGSPPDRAVDGLSILMEALPSEIPGVKFLAVRGLRSAAIVAFGEGEGAPCLVSPVPSFEDRVAKLFMQAAGTALRSAGEAGGAAAVGEAGAAALAAEAPAPMNAAAPETPVAEIAQYAPAGEIAAGAVETGLGAAQAAAPIAMVATAAAAPAAAAQLGQAASVASVTASTLQGLVRRPATGKPTAPPTAPSMEVANLAAAPNLESLPAPPTIAETAIPAPPQRPLAIPQGPAQALADAYAPQSAAWAVQQLCGPSVRARQPIGEAAKAAGLAPVEALDLPNQAPGDLTFKLPSRDGEVLLYGAADAAAACKLAIVHAPYDVVGMLSEALASPQGGMIRRELMADPSKGGVFERLTSTDGSVYATLVAYRTPPGALAPRVTGYVEIGVR